jgi:hypothetical protein
VNDVFLTQEWFANLAATGFDSAARPRLWAFEQDGRIVGCVPMADGFRSDAPMGTTLASLSNYYSCLYGPIVPGKALPAQAWATLARAIRQNPDHWPVIDFHPLDTESDFFSGMLAGLKAGSYWTDTLFCFGNWFFEVEGRDYSQYLASRTSSCAAIFRAQGRSSIPPAPGTSKSSPTRGLRWRQQSRVRACLQSELEAA